MRRDQKLEELKQLFKKHHEELLVDRVRLEKEFQENSPGQPLPDYMQDDFSLPESLAFLCEYMQHLGMKDGQ